MGAWNEVLEETKKIGSVYDLTRRKYSANLSNLTKRNVIIYYSGWLQKSHLGSEFGINLGINDADKNGFMSVIHELNRDKGLDLILHTPGGDLAATESLVEYLNTMFSGNIRAIIPQLAMSAGTIIALGCKQIIMGKQSSIGPIDPQFGGMSAQGLLDEFDDIGKQIKNDPEKAYLWDPILRQISPGFITECKNAVKWSNSMAEQFLNRNMFVNDKESSAKVKNIVDGLTQPKKNYSHGKHIDLKQAKEMFGAKLLELECDQNLQDAVLTLHHCTMVTLQATGAYKIIENQIGRAYIQMAEGRFVGPQS